MPEYRAAPELGRGYSVIAIHSTLFNKNDRNALPTVIAYHYSSDVDVAVDIAQDKSTGEYTVTKYVRCTDNPTCYRAILAVDKKLKNLERSAVHRWQTGALRTHPRRLEGYAEMP